MSGITCGWISRVLDELGAGGSRCPRVSEDARGHDALLRWSKAQDSDRVIGSRGPGKDDEAPTTCWAPVWRGGTCALGPVSAA